MIAKLPFLKVSGRLFIRSHLTAYVSSLSGANYIETNHHNDQNPPSSSQFEAKIQSLKNKLHPETLINVLSSTTDLNSSLRLFNWASLQSQFQHTADTYYHIIMKLGMASRVDEMEGFCNEMVKARFLSTEETLLRLLDSFMSCHKLDEALRVFHVLNSIGYKPSIGLINRILGVLVKEKMGIKSTLYVYKEMVKASIVPTIETLNYLLQALFDADRVDSVLDQYKRMQKKGCSPNSRTYEIMVSNLLGKNLLNETIFIMNEILENGCDLESKFFSDVLPILFKINKHDLGLKLFEKMKTCNIVPDLLVYEVLIQHYSKNLCMKNAINLFNEMISMDLKPSDRVFLDLVNGFCVLNKLSEAKQFLEDQQVTEANSYNILLKGYCQDNDFVQVILLFQKTMKNNITNNLSWNILIRYVSENQRNDIVHKILSKMIISGCEPDSATYSAIIIAKCHSNEVNDAINLFNHVCAEQWVVDSSCYNTLIEKLCQTGHIQDATEVFRYMSGKNCTLCSSSFSFLIKGLCLKGEVNKAVNLLSVGYYSGQSCSNEDYNIIIKSMSRLSKCNDLLIIVARMVIQGYSLDSEAYNELVINMTESQRSNECALFLNLMVKDGFLPGTEILSNSFSFLARKLQLHTVLPMINRLCSVSNYEALNPAMCNMLINGLWKEGYRDEARWLLDIMLEKGWVPDGGTHQLLVNSVASEVSGYEKGDTQDEIVSILSEGFGEL